MGKIVLRIVHMQQIHIHNKSQQSLKPLEAVYCDTFFCQLRGLTFRRTLPGDRGLLLVQKNDSRINSAIHMMFVFFDLAVVWINSAYNVVDLRLARRWRPFYMPVEPAKYILELAADRIDDFRVGDIVEFQKLPVK